MGAASANIARLPAAEAAAAAIREPAETRGAFWGGAGKMCVAPTNAIGDVPENCAACVVALRSIGCQQIATKLKKSTSK